MSLVISCRAAETSTSQHHSHTRFLSSSKRWRTLVLREVKLPAPGHTAQGRARAQPPSSRFLLWPSSARVAFPVPAPRLPGAGLARKALDVFIA